MSYPLTLAGIAYKELHEGSGQITIAKESTAERAFQCAWADRINLAKALYGYTLIVGGALLIFAATPHPDISNLFPTEIKIEPVGKSTGTNAYADAKLTVKYTSLNFNPSSPDPVDLREEKLRTSYELLLIPGEPYDEDTHEGGTAPIQVVIPKIEYDLTIHRVPVLPFAKVVTFMGVDGKPKVNSTTFMGAAAGHMLFLGCDADRKTTSFGVQDWDVTYHFQYSHIDHRKIYDPTTDTFVQKLHKVTNNPIYDSADFNGLLY